MKLIFTYVLYTCTSRFLLVAARSYSPPVCPPLRDHMVPDPGICVYAGGCTVVTVTMFKKGNPRLGAADDVTCHEVAIPVAYNAKCALQNYVCIFVVGPKTRSSAPRLSRRTANLTHT